MNWAPITTAAKEVVTIMGFYRGLARHVHWSPCGGGVWKCAITGIRLCGRPSHWNHMPDPPKQ